MHYYYYQGVIQSPEYPQAYTANVDCLWLLETANFQDRIYLDCDSVELGKYYYSRITMLLDILKLAKIVRIIDENLVWEFCLINAAHLLEW